MPFGSLESYVKSVLVVSLFTIIMSPVFFATLPATMAQKLNLTAGNATNNLNNLVFKQTNSTAICGSAAGGCTAKNSTGGVYTQVGSGGGIFSSFAFVLNGFGDLVTSLVNTPFIMGAWIGESLSIIPVVNPVAAGIQTELPAFIDFIMIIICVSAIMKYPLRSG